MHAWTFQLDVCPFRGCGIGGTRTRRQGQRSLPIQSGHEQTLRYHVENYVPLFISAGKHYVLHRSAITGDQRLQEVVACRQVDMEAVGVALQRKEFGARFPSMCRRRQ